MLRELLNNPELLAHRERPVPQQIIPGPFGFGELHWTDDLVQEGQGLQPVRKACIPTSRVPDLLKGVSSSSAEFSLYLRNSAKNKQGSLTRPKADSFELKQVWNCSFGPEDHRNVKQLLQADSKPKEGKGSRRQRTALGQSIKRGCKFSFTTKQLYRWPDITDITLYHDQHCDSQGQPCHGTEDPTAQNTRAAVAPRISDYIREWVVQHLRMGLTVSKIMSLHNKEVAAKLEAAADSHR